MDKSLLERSQKYEIKTEPFKYILRADCKHYLEIGYIHRNIGLEVTGPQGCKASKFMRF